MDLFLAFAAAFYTYEEYFEWYNITAGVTGVVDADDKNIAYGLFMPKSPFYKLSYEKKAKKKIKSIVKNARSYAKKNYPKDQKYGMIKYFDEWICKHTYYNTAAAQDENYNTEIDYFSHCIYGPLLKGYGVCESFARTMTRFMIAAGIPNIFVEGEAYIGTDHGGHAWNQILLKGKWYLEDSTWNNINYSDETEKKSSTGQFLLVGSQEDTASNLKHVADGVRIVGQKEFAFPAIEATRYHPKEKTEVNGINDPAEALLPAA